MKEPMRLSLIAPLLVAALAPQGEAAPPPAPSANLDAVLWTQQSAEYEAAARQAYTTARRQIEVALADTSWTAAEEQASPFGHKPPAVILDVDETVLDNTGFQARLLRSGEYFSGKAWYAWCEEAVAPAVPGALEFCQWADARGVRVVFITNRRTKVWEATRQNLARLDFPLEPGATNLLTRDESSNKSPRRAKVAADHRVLLLVGDALGDFSESLGKHPAPERLAGVQAHSTHWGERWIVVPNPMYGDWMRALFDYEYLDQVPARARKFRALTKPPRPPLPTLPTTPPAEAPPKPSSSSRSEAPNG